MFKLKIEQCYSVLGRLRSKLALYELTRTRTIGYAAVQIKNTVSPFFLFEVFSSIDVKNYDTRFLPLWGQNTHK